ncbi:tetratricopeptide repeat protein [Costertonia aggregata]|uniref:Tetratricopeptide repeat protein n=1 Tax=Costertonia aggregata TaxID=343403 RepID=A0A7H9AW98_9FLAO|nr:tetratricopeptide repeat protein [Costertonia aggregata]
MSPLQVFSQGGPDSYKLNAEGIVQKIPDSFKETVDSLFTKAPETFVGIHSVLRNKRTDTILMRYVERLAAEKKYAAGQSYALNELGRTYRNKSLYSQSIALHQRALDIAETADNLEFRVSSLNNLGVVYHRISSVRTAMDYNQKALELAETVKNPSDGLKRSINVSLNRIGNLYQTLKQYDLAIVQFRKSLKLEAELGNKLGQAVNYQNIGECQELQGNLQEALKNYETSLSFNEQINSDMGRVICNTSISQVYIKLGQSTKAVPKLEKSLQLAKTLGDGFLIAPAEVNLGWAQMLTGNYDEAEKSMLGGLKTAEKLNLEEYMSKASHLLSELFKKRGEYEKALDYKDKAQQIDEKILEESTVRYVNDIIFRYDSEKKSSEIEKLVKQNEITQLKLRKNRTTLIIGGIALALLAGIFYILYRQFQLNNEKKLLTLEQSMLRSQMNPHFLFNSLNSIKLYIINNEKKNAVYYLNKFSKLVRKILEASSLKEIPLAEELETVELYMNIENIRFSNEIDFNIMIDDNIDVHTIKIPSLILQPFLENALWHGLSSKEGSKKIDLRVSKQDSNFIQISITDNGVGRDASEKIKESKVLKRKSVGIDITKERLANFSRDYQNSFNVDIVDLYDDNSKPAGTKVILYIPTI